MTKLPKIFHNEEIISNNKKSYFDSKKSDSFNKKDKIDYYNYINKNVIVALNNGDYAKGIVISVQKDYILLNDGTYIKYSDIKELK